MTQGRPSAFDPEGQTWKTLGMMNARRLGYPRSYNADEYPFLREGEPPPLAFLLLDLVELILGGSCVGQL